MVLLNIVIVIVIIFYKAFLILFHELMRVCEFASRV